MRDQGPGRGNDFGEDTGRRAGHSLAGWFVSLSRSAARDPYPLIFTLRAYAQSESDRGQRTSKARVSSGIRPESECQLVGISRSARDELIISKLKSRLKLQ